MSIRTNIEEIMEEIGNGNTVLGQEVREKSVAAIISGQGSPQWETYMNLFSSTTEQLARLMPTDTTLGDPIMDEARTYLVGNGMCGSDTTGTRLIEGVGDVLDEDLP